MELLMPSLIIGILGLVFGVGLAYASKKFEVKVDEKIALVREALPGVNCGACGQTGCDGFAEGVVNGSCAINGCPVGGNEVLLKLSEIMGVRADNIDEKVARVICAGNNKNSRTKFAYSGILDCTAASNLHGGPMSCSYGCVGMGNCVKACGFGAISVIDGVAKVNESECTSCGKCIKACPKKIIEMISKNSLVTITCSSHDKGAVARKNCNVGCIACGKCEKICPTNAIAVKDNLARIDYTKCINCKECVFVCPTKAINTILR